MANVATRDELGFWLTADETDRWSDNDPERQASARAELRARARALARVMGAKTIQLRDGTGGRLEIVSVAGAPEDNGQS
jgi:hypothetical protein